MSDLMIEALKDEDISELYYDRKATLIGIDNYIEAVDTLHAKESHTRSSKDRYYRLILEVPEIIKNAKDQNNQLLAALCKYNSAIEKDAMFISDQTDLRNKMESLEDKFSELSEKLETTDVIAKPVAAAPLAPAGDVSEAIKLLSKQISDAQVVTNKYISDAQVVTNKNISDAQAEAQKNSKELTEALKSCNKSKLKRVQPSFIPLRKF